MSAWVSPEFKAGFSLTLGAIAAISALGLGLRILGWDGPYDDSDPPDGGRSRMAVRVDHLTGCQYLADQHGGLYPRMDASGQQICRERP